MFSSFNSTLNIWCCKNKTVTKWKNRRYFETSSYILFSTNPNDKHWATFAVWVFEKKILDFLFYIYPHVNIYQPPHYCTTLPPGVIIWTNIYLFYLIMLLQMIFKRFLTIYLYIFLCKIPNPLLMPRPLSHLSCFKQTWIYTIWGCFHTSFSFLTNMYFSRRSFRKIPRHFQ